MTGNPEIVSRINRDLRALELSHASRDIRDAIHALENVLDADDALDFLSHDELRALTHARRALTDAKSGLARRADDNSDD